MLLCPWTALTAGASVDKRGSPTVVLIVVVIVHSEAGVDNCIRDGKLLTVGDLLLAGVARL